MQIKGALAKAGRSNNQKAAGGGGTPAVRRNIYILEALINHLLSTQQGRIVIKK
jgi:hypothetical protein